MKELPAKGHKLRNFYSNIRDVCTVMNSVGGRFIVASFAEGSVKAMSAAQALCPDAKIEAIITIDPMLDPISYLLEAEK